MTYILCKECHNANYIACLMVIYYYGRNRAIKTFLVINYKIFKTQIILVILVYRARKLFINL